MKRKGLRAIEKNKPQTIGIKLLILAGFLGLVLISPELIKIAHVYTKKDQSTKNKISFSLPKKIDWGKIINFKAIESEGFALKDQFEEDVLGKTDKIISKTASDAASAVANTVSKTVFDTTIKPIVKQLEKLPPDQQKRARELICK